MNTENEYEDIVTGLSYATFKTHGDSAEGELTEVRLQPSNIKPGTEEKVWILKGLDGAFIGVSGPAMARAALEKCDLGDYVRLVYNGDVPHKKKGMSPLKQFQAQRKKKGTWTRPAPDELPF